MTAQRRDREPALAVLSGRISPGECLCDSDAMWEAWRRLGHFEDHSVELGPNLAPELIVLWAVWRFGDTAPGDVLLGELVGDDMMPRFRDPLIEDMLLVAFALGAGWGAATDRDVVARQQPSPGARPHLAVAWKTGADSRGSDTGKV
jgi:hypothetical protein